MWRIDNFQHFLPLQVFLDMLHISITLEIWKMSTQHYFACVGLKPSFFVVQKICTKGSKSELYISGRVSKNLFLQFNLLNPEIQMVKLRNFSTPLIIALFKILLWEMRNKQNLYVFFITQEIANLSGFWRKHSHGPSRVKFNGLSVTTLSRGILRIITTYPICLCPRLSHSAIHELTKPCCRSVSFLTL